MFSKSKINDPAAKPAEPEAPSAATSAPAAPKQSDFKASAPKAKPPASVLSADLHVTGNMKTTGDIQVEGTVEGDIRAHLLTIGESATIKGEVVADDVVINGRIVGRVRGLKGAFDIHGACRRRYHSQDNRNRKRRAFRRLCPASG